MLAPEYPIRTDRLLLRPLVPADADALHAYQSRPEVCRYIPYEPRSREEIAARLADPDKSRATLDAPGQALALAVVLVATGELIGDIMLFWHSAVHRSGEIGYVLNPDHQGHGYATEAAAAVLDLGFGALQLRRIVARIDARNRASAGVCRRLGMRQEAVLVENEWFKGDWSTEVQFALLEREWREGPNAEPSPRTA